VLRVAPLAASPAVAVDVPSRCTAARTPGWGPGESARRPAIAQVNVTRHCAWSAAVASAATRRLAQAGRHTSARSATLGRSRAGMPRITAAQPGRIRTPVTCVVSPTARRTGPAAGRTARACCPSQTRSRQPSGSSLMFRGHTATPSQVQATVEATAVAGRYSWYAETAEAWPARRKTATGLRGTAIVPVSARAVQEMMAGLSKTTHTTEADAKTSWHRITRPELKARAAWRRKRWPSIPLRLTTSTATTP
jgi:hypothetical protein